MNEEEAGFMDDDVAAEEATGGRDPRRVVQSESIDMASLGGMSRFIQGKQGNEGVAAVSANMPVSPSRGMFQEPPVDNGPPIPEGRGGADSLREGILAAGRAMFGEAPRKRQEAPQRLQESAPTRRTPRSRKSVLEGDIVQHKESGKLGTVVESSRSGMKVRLDGFGIVEVRPSDAKKYKLVGRGV